MPTNLSTWFMDGPIGHQFNAVVNNDDDEEAVAEVVAEVEVSNSNIVKS